MGWIITASIVLLIVLLLAANVTVIFDYNGELALKVKYLCFTIVRIPRKKRKPKKARKKSAKKDKTVNAVKDDKAEEKKSEEIPEKQANTAKIENKPEKKKTAKKSGEKKPLIDLKSLSLGDKIDLLKKLLSNVSKPVKKLFKRIVFSHMSIRIVCGGDDAAQTAIKFGLINMAAGNALGLLDSFFTLKPLDDMYITVDYQSEKSLYDCYFEVRMSLFAGFAGLFGLLGAFIKLLRVYKKKQEKPKVGKTAETAKSES